MIPPTPEDQNPFEAPLAEIGDRAIDLGGDGDAELIRRHHLGRERSIRSIGLLCYLTAALAGLFAGVAALAAAGVIDVNRRADPASAGMQTLLFVAGIAIYGVVAGVSAAMGFGLRRLQVWARWTMMVLSMLALLYLLMMAAVLMAGVLPVPNPGGIAAFLLLFDVILGYVFYLLVTPRAGVVFSPEYREVIAKTPGIRTRTSLVVKIALSLLIAVIVLFAVVGLAMRGK